MNVLNSCTIFMAVNPYLYYTSGKYKKTLNAIDLSAEDPIENSNGGKI